MKTLLIEAQLTKTSRVKDGTVNMNFRTMREVSSEEYLLMDKYWTQNGWVAFKMDQFDGTELPEDNTKVQGQKSPSTRLRLALFAKHMNKGGGKDTFPAYYNRCMDAFEQAVNDSY